jgi:hypothetical protein
MLTININTPKEVRIKPNVALDMNCGNNGVAHFLIVATLSMVEIIVGSVDKHNPRTTMTIAMVCPGGFAVGNCGLVISISWLVV